MNSLCGRTLVVELHLRVAKQFNLLRSGLVTMKNRIGWLAMITVLVYEVVQIIPSSVFNHAVSTLASAVWGS